MKVKILNVNLLSSGDYKKYWSQYIGQIFEVAKRVGNEYFLDMRQTKEKDYRVWSKREIKEIK